MTRLPPRTDYIALTLTLVLGGAMFWLLLRGHHALETSQQAHIVLAHAEWVCTDHEPPLDTCVEYRRTPRPQPLNQPTARH